jgi:hypothetical protein
MPLPSPRELDEHASMALDEARRTLQRAFAEGIGTARDFPATMKSYRELAAMLDAEDAVEASLKLRDRWQADEDAKEETQREGGSKRDEGQHIAVFIDGSSTSFAALRYAMTGLCRPKDHLHLIHIMPYESFRADADRILQQAYDYAHHAGGVRVSLFSVACLPFCRL